MLLLLLFQICVKEYDVSTALDAKTASASAPQTARHLSNRPMRQEVTRAFALTTAVPTWPSATCNAPRAITGWSYKYFIKDLVLLLQPILSWPRLIITTRRPPPCRRRIPIRWPANATAISKVIHGNHSHVVVGWQSDGRTCSDMCSYLQGKSSFLNKLFLIAHVFFFSLFILRLNRRYLRPSDTTVPMPAWRRWAKLRSMPFRILGHPFYCNRCSWMRAYVFFLLIRVDINIFSLFASPDVITFENRLYWNWCWAILRTNWKCCIFDESCSPKSYLRLLLFICY